MFIPLFLTALILSSLSALTQETTPITIKLEKSDLEGISVNLSEIADEISYIKLETHPQALIGSSNRYYLTQIPNGYLIRSSRGTGNIMMFNSNGKFKGLVGHEGRGPGEYYGVYTILYDKSLHNILVLVQKKVLLYDMDGKFLSTVNIDTNDCKIEWMCIKDDHTWLFTYNKPLKEQLFEVGVLATNKQGEIIKQYNLTNEENPGCYSIHTQRNLLYQREQEIYYTQYDYLQTYKLSKDDYWLPYIKIETPFNRAPVDLYKDINPRKMNEFQRKNGIILSAILHGHNMIIKGGTPKVFNILIDLESGNKQNFSYDIDFKRFGLTNDLDGGMPFNLVGFDSEGVSIEMVDATDLLDYSEQGLLNPDGKDYGPHKNLKEVLESTKPDDNPILVVVHVKQ